MPKFKKVECDDLIVGEIYLDSPIYLVRLQFVRRDQNGNVYFKDVDNSGQYFPNREKLIGFTTFVDCCFYQEIQ